MEIRSFNTASLIWRGFLFGTCSIGLSASAADMPAELDEYEWRATIHGSMETGRTYKIRLPSDVMDGFRSFPLDVRVVDREGTIWPSIVFARPDRDGLEPVRITARTQVDITKDVEYTVKEFIVEPDRRSGTVPAHNRAMILLNGTDFVRRVEVWGGQDINTLVMLGSGFLVEQKSPAPVRNRSIDYPETTVPLIVIRVFNDARNAEKPLDWRATEVMRVIRDDADHEQIELKKLPLPEDEADRPGIWVLHLDTGAQNRPLLYLTLETSSHDFALPVRVFGRNNPTNAWRWVADGGIHDMAGQQQNRIALARSDFRYLKVEIFHYAEKAPKITHVLAGAIPHYLVFIARSNAKAYMYFGSPRYQLPVSEFSRGITSDSIQDAAELTLTRRQTNPTRVASSLTAYGRTLMRFGIVIVILLVAVVSIRIIRHRYL